MNKKWKRKIPLFIGAVVLGAFAFSGLVMLLWNATLTPVFHLSAITIWQAAGILLLSRMLFSGFKGRRQMAGCNYRKMMFMKWQNLTEEEKAEFRSKMHGCRSYGNMQQA